MHGHMNVKYGKMYKNYIEIEWSDPFLKLINVNY